MTGAVAMGQRVAYRSTETLTWDRGGSGSSSDDLAKSHWPLDEDSKVLGQFRKMASP